MNKLKIILITTFLITVPILFWYANQKRMVGGGEITAVSIASKFDASEIKSKYTLDSAKLTLPAKDENSVKVEIGDNTPVVKGLFGATTEPEFTPNVKFSRWDEVSMTLKPKMIDKVAKADKALSFDKEKIVLDTPDISYNLYDLGTSTDNPEGAFEYEVDLKENPKTNVMEFTLETEGLDFFYQPALTEQEIASGSVREENVVGSYAIYTSEQKTNWKDGKVYGTGKVGHIFRPKIIDSVGNWVWGELNIDKEKGILSVTIPQEFLDKAVYPVRHATGLTFGYTSVGVTSAQGAGYAYFTKGTPTGGDGTVDSLTFNAAKYGAGGNIKAMFWLVSDLTKVANSIAPVVNVNNAKQWWTTTYGTSPSVVNNANYYIGTIAQTQDTVMVSFDNGSTGDGGYDANNYTTPTNLSAPLGNNTRIHSIYATYTASGGSTSCTYSGTGDWNIKYSDNCYITSNVSVNGTCNLIYDGAGSFASNANINCVKVVGGAGFKAVFASGKNFSEY